MCPKTMLILGTRYTPFDSTVAFGLALGRGLASGTAFATVIGPRVEVPALILVVGAAVRMGRVSRDRPA